MGPRRFFPAINETARASFRTTGERNTVRAISRQEKCSSSIKTPHRDFHCSFYSHARRAQQNRRQRGEKQLANYLSFSLVSHRTQRDFSLRPRCDRTIKRSANTTQRPPIKRSTFRILRRRRSATKQAKKATKEKIGKQRPKSEPNLVDTAPSSADRRPLHTDWNSADFSFSLFSPLQYEPGGVVLQRRDPVGQELRSGRYRKGAPDPSVR